MAVQGIGAFSAVGAGRNESPRAQLMAVCKEFEQIFLRMLMKSMRSTVPKEGLFPQSTAMEVYEGLLDGEYAKAAAESGGLGVGQMLYDYFLPSISGREVEDGEQSAKS